MGKLALFVVVAAIGLAVFYRDNLAHHWSRMGHGSGPSVSSSAGGMGGSLSRSFSGTAGKLGSF